MDRYSQLRDRASQLVGEFAAGGPVVVMAPERAAADEVARLACKRALLGVQRLGFRELAPELAAPEMDPSREMESLVFASNPRALAASSSASQPSGA